LRGGGIATDDGFHEQVGQTSVSSSLGRAESASGQRDGLGDPESPSSSVSHAYPVQITHEKICGYFTSVSESKHHNYLKAKMKSLNSL